MTPEERAQMLWEELSILLLSEATRDGETALIASAIRSADNDALERAARLAAGQYGAAGLKTSEDIRNLKHKDI